MLKLLKFAKTHTYCLNRKKCVCKYSWHMVREDFFLRTQSTLSAVQTNWGYKVPCQRYRRIEDIKYLVGGTDELRTQSTLSAVQTNWGYKVPCRRYRRIEDTKYLVSGTDELRIQSTLSAVQMDRDVHVVGSASVALQWKQ